MNRFGAFATHLGISLVIFVFLAYLVVYVWYPDFFFASDGGWQGMRIIIAVDLVLGPTLTLIVFKKGKPGLKTDLTLIGTFQAICLVAGTWVVYSERPLALVYVDGQFFSMSADAYLGNGIEVPDLSRFPGPMPKRLAVDVPEDPALQSELRKQALKRQRPLRTFTELYKPLELTDLDLEREAFPQEELLDRDQEAQQLPLWLAEHGGTLDDYAFLPFGTRFAYIFLGVDRENGEVKGILRTPAPL